MKRVAVIDVELGDGMAFGMGDGAYLVVQHDEYGRRQAVLLSADDMAAIGATERGRVDGIVAKLRDAAEGALEARTALKDLAGRGRCREALEGRWRLSADSGGHVGPVGDKGPPGSVVWTWGA